MNYRDKILSTRKIVSIDCGEFGAYKLSTISYASRVAWEEECFDDNDNVKPNSHARMKLLIRCLVDDHGNRLFADNEFELAEQGIDATLVPFLFSQALQLNKMYTGAIADAKKNSEPAPT